MSKPSLRHKRFNAMRRVPVTDRERMILSIIRREGEVSRSELIRLADLSGPAVFRATEDLAGRGLVKLGDRVANGPGKPSNVVSLRANALATVGLSVMTDYAEAVLIDFTGEVRAQRDVGVPDMDCDAVLENLLAFVDDASSESKIEADAIFGLGVAIAGYFVDDAGRVNPAAPLDSWALKDLKRIVSAKIPLEVTIENIANAAAVGERLLGVGKWADNFAYINVSHGFGSGLILNGELHRGRNGNAGEVAGMLSQYAGLPIPNLETLRDALAQEGIETTDVNDLVARFRDDWPGIAQWVAWAEPSFSFLACMFHRTLDCDAVVLGGRLPHALAERIAASIRPPEIAFPPRRGAAPPPTKVVPAEITSRSAAIGAAAIPLRAAYFD